MRFDLTINEFAQMIASGAKLSVYDKDTWRPYCHVRDVSAAVVRVLEAPNELVGGEIFNVGSDENNFTKEQIVGEVLRHVDGEVEYVDGGGDARDYRVSFAKIRERLGFRCRLGLNAAIPGLVQATQSGLFRPSQRAQDRYGNYQIRGGVV